VDENPSKIDFADLYGVQQALAAYVVAIDTRTLSLFEQCFAPDAVVELGEMGRMTATEYAAGATEGLKVFDATQHHLGLPAIRLDGDRGWARTYFVAQHTRISLLPRPHFTIAGWYDDEFAKINGRWLITRRIGTPVWSDG